MKKLHRLRRFDLCLAVVAVALFGAVPAGALATSESSSGAVAGEAGNESTGGTAEATPPATSEEASATAPPPPSAGWVPQDSGTEASSQEGTSTRRGSSLGSGASSKPSAPVSEDVAPAGSSSGYYEPAAPAPSTVEETASEPQAVSPAAPEPQVEEETPPKVGHAALGTATPVALPDSSQTDDADSLPAIVAPVASVRDRVASDSGGLSLPILILGALVLLYLGGRVMLGPVEPNLFRFDPLRHVRRVLSRV